MSTMGKHTTHIDEMEIVTEGNEIKIYHPYIEKNEGGVVQTHDVADVMGFRAATIAELTAGHLELERHKQSLSDMGSPLPSGPLTERYMAIHQKWLDAGSPEIWLKEKGVLTKVIGLVEPK